MHPDLELRNVNAYDDGYGAGYREGQRDAERAENAREKELRAAIHENSVVLLHLAAATKDETLASLLQGVHDSLTDAL